MKKILITTKESSAGPVIISIKDMDTGRNINELIPKAAPIFDEGSLSDFSVSFAAMVRAHIKSQDYVSIDIQNEDFSSGEISE